jgi:hypothetical protein
VLAWVLSIGVMAFIAAGAFYGWSGLYGGSSCGPTGSGGSDSGGNC